jgi:O-methyltransferase involved in polyketide biosynthesis
MPSRISPTAHYTSEVWRRNRLSHPALGTITGRALYAMLRPLSLVSARLMEGLTLERYLVDRHLAMDRLLEEAIEIKGARQIVEVASGLSPRGFRFARRYQHLGLRYLEGDLPEMASLKRHALARISGRSPSHEVRDLDLLAIDAPSSLEHLVGTTFDRDAPLVVVIEGLLSYFDTATAGALWPRLAGILDRFPFGLLLANTELADEAGRIPLIRGFAVALSKFTAAPVRFHFHDEPEAMDTLTRAGFSRVALHRPCDLLGPRKGPTVVRILEASVGGAEQTSPEPAKKRT